ncbi:MAG: Rieske 2Fe-2S domain-containing protein [Verrucomicrobia bacterium]|nr:Rieske 2Fe-2S domain-containing protein [Verrucomicrobiota bacterium]
MTPTPLAQLSDLPAGRPLRVRSGEREIALFLLDGEVFALDDRCPHKAGPLGEGFCENGQVFCPLHGWGFDIRTGACAEVPARPATRVPVRVEDGRIYLASQ